MRIFHYVPLPGAGNVLFQQTASWELANAEFWHWVGVPMCNFQGTWGKLSVNFQIRMKSFPALTQQICTPSAGPEHSSEQVLRREWKHAADAKMPDVKRRTAFRKRQLSERRTESRLWWCKEENCLTSNQGEALFCTNSLGFSFCVEGRQ